MSQSTKAASPRTINVFVCTNLRMSGSSCAGRDSKPLLKAMQNRADARVLDGAPLVKVQSSVCMGYCKEGPNVKVIGGKFYHQTTLDDIDGILDDAEQVKRD
ncbi:MAG: (2Fe-2S) ferredoxin domain-containing protein [Magnetovibrio sp.]|nr:(2Fe-2S) ferredoxin domain-containing protein [Magnetovibrio sp.]